jgi:type I restriction enzyme S subunit
LKPIRGNLEFLANLMETIDYRPWITGAAQPKLTGERLLSIVVPVPPAEEQDLIMEWVNAVTRSLRIAIGRAQREISLIREYRTRLIADVVSGKVDVRGLAADLPDSAADEMQTFEEADDLGEDEEIDESVDAGEDDFAAD